MLLSIEGQNAMVQNYNFPIIDCHTHLFNLGFVPIQGILVSWRVPNSFAQFIAPLLQLMIQTTKTTKKKAAPRAALNRALMEEASLGSLIPEFVSLSPSPGEVPLIDQLIDKNSALLDSVALPPWMAITSYSLRELMLAKALIALARYISENGWQSVEWLLFLLNHESQLFRYLDRTYPISASGGLFVHHMMDMDNHYPPGQSKYEFTGEQIRRMRAMVEASDGKLLTFVAFDPFRDNSLEIIEQSINDLCCGVKFYPPNGYRPIDNHDRDIFGPVKAHVVNQRNQELYNYCITEGVPLFSHCTPTGMESRIGVTGQFSNPKHWRRVLEQYGTLRLALGHAGGEEPWLAEDNSTGDNFFVQSYAYDVVDLCVTYPNVYCEFGHFHAIFDPTKRLKLQRRLERVVEEYGDSFANKMIYGSDWHMISRFDKHESYLDLFYDLFDRSDILRPYIKRFFFSNALRYLNLNAYLQRNNAKLTDAAKDYLSKLISFQEIPL